MFYGPVSPSYWKQRFRLVIINMEPYGYHGICEVDRDTLIDWLYDAGDSGTRTTRYSFAILSVLLATLECGTPPSNTGLQSAYTDDETLEGTLDRTVYFNIRPESNEQKSQDFAAITGVGSSKIGPLIWREIEALDAHAVFISGKAGLNALNGISTLVPQLSFRELRRTPSGTVFRSIPHPSRPNYDNWLTAIREVEEGIRA